MLTIILLLLQPGSAENTWKDALGDLSEVSPEHRLWFEDAREFQASHGHGKPVSHYLSHWHNRPDSGRHTLVVRWMDPEPPKLKLSELSDYLEAFFQLPVRVEMREVEFPGPRGGKFSAEALQRRLLEDLADDTFAVIGLTERDVFSEDSGPGRLLFGQGHYYNRSAIASFNRLGTSDKKLYAHRAFKLVTHELAHTFSVEHCGYFRCLLNPSYSVASSDRRPLFLCPVCLRKFHAVLRFDPRDRYLAVYSALAPALPKDRNWLLGRLENAVR
jgi:archaemetzincin